MKKSTVKNIFIVLLLFGITAFSMGSQASADSYAGVTFIVEGSTEMCSIVRFGEGFSLSEADALYALISQYAVNSKSVDWIQSILPSENLANGVTPETLLNDIAKNGTGACLINNKPVDHLAYTDFYKCSFEGSDHTCMHSFVHTGEKDLSSQGIPYNTLAEVGAVVVAEPIWDAGVTKMLSAPVQSPRTVANLALLLKKTLDSIKKDRTVKNILKNRNQNKVIVK